jgi:cytochrome P450
VLFTSRFPMTAPLETLQYGGYAFPPGTTMSMTLRDVSLNSTVFAHPLEFRPERWLPDNPELARLNKYYLPFSRGSRMCVGINLAYAELYLVISSVFRRYDMELFDTVYERDVAVERDGIVGEPTPDSPGIRVKLVPEEDYTIE